MIEQLWTDSISRYEGHSVSTAILSRRRLKHWYFYILATMAVLQVLAKLHIRYMHPC